MHAKYFCISGNLTNSSEAEAGVEDTVSIGSVIQGAHAANNYQEIN
jgi:hypothetical protein